MVVYAKELGASEEKMLRAVVLSDLITIHQKSGIGRLSAYCGAISAGSVSYTHLDVYKRQLLNKSVKVATKFLAISVLLN